jgi:hypothetical protein
MYVVGNNSRAGSSSCTALNLYWLVGEAALDAGDVGVAAAADDAAGGVALADFKDAGDAGETRSHTGRVPFGSVCLFNSASS